MEAIAIVFLLVVTASAVFSGLVAQRGVLEGITLLGPDRSRPPVRHLLARRRFSHLITRVAR